MLVEQHARHLRPQTRERGGDRSRTEHGVGLSDGFLRAHGLSLRVFGKLLHQLAVGRHRVVPDGLNGRAAEVCAQVLKGRDAILLVDLQVPVVRGESA